MIRNLSTRSLRSDFSNGDEPPREKSSARLQRRASIKSTSQFSAQCSEFDAQRQQAEEEKRKRDALNRMFGFPEAPSKVLALGKDGCAAVWWHHEMYYSEREQRISMSAEDVEHDDIKQGNLNEEDLHPAIYRRALDISSEGGRNDSKVDDTEVDNIDEEEDLGITHWEVHRYRKDRVRDITGVGSNSRYVLDIMDGGWKYKGFTRFDALLLEGDDEHQVVPQVLVMHLTNDYEYKFTVKAMNRKGCSAESSFSNPVMVEAPLPSGWIRFFDFFSSRHYYANVRLQMSSWTRPELDPYFLDEAVLSNFSSREIRHLRSLYDEEIAHFHSISVTRYLDVLRECGERASKWWVCKLFRGYARRDICGSLQPHISAHGGSDASEMGKNQRISDEDLAINSWQQFMEITNHIKEYRMAGKGQIVRKPMEKVLLFISQMMQVHNILLPKRAKLGDWMIDYNPLAEKKFYRNIVTGEQCWSLPPQIKFYVPPKLEEKLLKVFTYGDVEEFQQFFALLDVDHSGDLSPQEIKLLLRTLDINLSERKFNKLIRTVDLNGNGTIEFDEFCWMMYQIYRHDKKSFFTSLKSEHPKSIPSIGSTFFSAIGLSQKSSDRRRLHPQPVTTDEDGDGSEIDQDGDRHLRRSDSVASDLRSFGSNCDLRVFEQNKINGGQLSFHRMRSVLKYATKMIFDYSSAPPGKSDKLILQNDNLTNQAESPHLVRRDSSMSLNSQHTANVVQFTNSVRNLLTGVTTLEEEEALAKSKTVSSRIGALFSSSKRRMPVKNEVSRLNSSLSSFDEDEITNPNFSPIRSIRLKRDRRQSSQQHLYSGLNLETDDFEMEDDKEHGEGGSSVRLYAESDEFEFLSPNRSKTGREHEDDDSQDNYSHDEQEEYRSGRNRRMSISSTFSFNSGRKNQNDPNYHGQFCFCGCRRY